MPTLDDLGFKVVGANAPAPQPADPFIKSIIAKESGGDPNAVSSKGARGVMQIMPATAMNPGFGVKNIFDRAREAGIDVQDESEATAKELLGYPSLNTSLGTDYANAMKTLHGGNEKLAAAAFNAGPGAVAQYGGVPPFVETQNYAAGFNGSDTIPANTGGAGGVLAGTARPAATSQPQPDPLDALGFKRVDASVLRMQTPAPVAAPAPVTGGFMTAAKDFAKQYIPGIADTIAPYADAITGVAGQQANPEAALQQEAMRARAASQAQPTTLDGNVTPIEMMPRIPTSIPKPSDAVNEFMPPPTAKDSYAARTGRMAGQLTGMYAKFAPLQAALGPVLGPATGPVVLSVLQGGEAALENVANTTRGELATKNVPLEAAKGAALGVAQEATGFISNPLLRRTAGGTAMGLLSPAMEGRMPSSYEDLLNFLFGFATTPNRSGRTGERPSTANIDAEFPDRGPVVSTPAELGGPATPLALPDLRGDVIQGQAPMARQYPINIGPDQRALPDQTGRLALPDLRGDVIEMGAMPPSGERGSGPTDTAAVRAERIAYWQAQPPSLLRDLELEKLGAVPNEWRPAPLEGSSEPVAAPSQGLATVDMGTQARSAQTAKEPPQPPLTAPSRGQADANRTGERVPPQPQPQPALPTGTPPLGGQGRKVQTTPQAGAVVAPGNAAPEPVAQNTPPPAAPSVTAQQKPVRKLTLPAANRMANSLGIPRKAIGETVDEFVARVQRVEQERASAHAQRSAAGGTSQTDLPLTAAQESAAAANNKPVAPTAAALKISQPEGGDRSGQEGQKGRQALLIDETQAEGAGVTDSTQRSRSVPTTRDGIRNAVNKIASSSRWDGKVNGDLYPPHMSWRGYDIEGGSEYISLESPSGHEGITVRLSDHPQAKGGGYNAAAGYRHGEADFSINTSDGPAAIKAQLDAIANRVQELSAAEGAPTPKPTTPQTGASSGRVTWKYADGTTRVEEGRPAPQPEALPESAQQTPTQSEGQAQSQVEGQAAAQGIGSDTDPVVYFDWGGLGIRGGGKRGALIADGESEAILTSALKKAYADAGVPYESSAVRKALDTIQSGDHILSLDLPNGTTIHFASTRKWDRYKPFKPSSSVSVATPKSAVSPTQAAAQGSEVAPPAKRGEPITPEAVDKMPMRQVQRELSKRGLNASAKGGVMAARARLKAALGEESGASLNPGKLVDAAVKKVKRILDGDLENQYRAAGVTFSGDQRTTKERASDAKKTWINTLQDKAEWVSRPVDAVKSDIAKNFLERYGQEFSNAIFKAGREREQMMYDVGAQLPKGKRSEMRVAARVFQQGNPADIARLKRLHPEVAKATEKVMEYWKNKWPEIKESLRAQLLANFGETSAMRSALEDALALPRRASVQDIQNIAAQRRVDAQDLLDLKNHYDSIDTLGIDDYVSNIERGQIEITGRRADGSTVLMGYAVNESMAARKVISRLNDPRFSGVVEILTDYKHPDSYSHLEQISPKTYRKLRQQFGSEINKLNAGLNAKLARAKASGVLNRSVKATAGKKFAGPLAKNKGKLLGEDNLFDVVNTYIPSVNRSIAINPLIAEFKRISSQMPEGDVEIINRLIEDTKGRYYASDRLVDSLVDILPRRLRETIGHGSWSAANAMGRAVASFTKLAGRPIAGVVNGVTGTMKTLAGVRWKADYLIKAHQFAKTAQGKALLDWARGRVGVGVSSNDLAVSLGARSSWSASARTALKALQNGAWDVARREAFNQIDALALRGMQSLPETYLREKGFLANYLYLRDNMPHTMSHDELLFRAAQQTRVQQGIYDMANLPRLMRLGPATKSVLQFKQYLVNEISFLRDLPRRDALLYMLAGGVVAGPSYYVAMAKTLPLLAQAIDWTDLEETANEYLGWAYRGVAGALGGDITNPYSPQLPTRWEDLAGPAFGDLIRAAQTLSHTAKGDATARDYDQLLDDTVIAYRNMTALSEAINGDGWVHDDRGRPMYKLDTTPEMIWKAAGGKTLEESQRQIVNRSEAKRQIEQRNERTRAITTFLDQLENHGKADNTTIKWLVELGVSRKALSDAARDRKLPPDIRAIINAPKRSRMYLKQRQQLGIDALEDNE